MARVNMYFLDKCVLSSVRSSLNIRGNCGQQCACYEKKHKILVIGIQIWLYLTFVKVLRPHLHNDQKCRFKIQKLNDTDYLLKMELFF